MKARYESVASRARDECENILVHRSGIARWSYLVCSFLHSHFSPAHTHTYTLIIMHKFIMHNFSDDPSVVSDNALHADALLPPFFCETLFHFYIQQVDYWT
jgi:hypothetical protein